MKNLVIAALALGGLMQATGCIIVSDDDVVDDSSFLVTWNLESELQASPGAVSCVDADVAFVRSIAETVGGGGRFEDLYDCSDLTHETNPIPLGEYVVWVEALDVNKDLVAVSGSTQETLFDGNPVGATFTFPVDIAFFGLTWLLEDTGSPISCADAGGVGVELSITASNDANTFFDQEFNCIDGEGTTTLAVPVESYEVSVTVIDADGFGLSESNSTTELLEYGNQLNELGEYIFDFTE